MGLGAYLLGKATAAGTKTVLNSVGDSEVKLRRAFTGEESPEVKEAFVALEGELGDARSKIIVAEAQGQSSLQRNWRPILMLAITAIVVNNYLIYPYLALFTDKVIVLDLPDKLWTLMTVGVGGYIGGRSLEKIFKS